MGYFQNPLTQQVIFLESPTLTNLFTQKKIRYNNTDEDLTFNTKYNVSNIIINLNELTTSEISYVKFESIPFLNYLHPSPQCTLTFNFCYKSCKTCTELGTFDNMKCTSCFDYIAYNNAKGECVNCKSIDQFYAQNLKKCVPEIFRGYYVKTDDEFNVLRECPFDCSERQSTEEGILFCKNIKFVLWYILMRSYQC